MAKTIDCTPTWTGVLKYYLAVLEDGTTEGKKLATQELYNMAKAADQYNELINKTKSNKS